MAAMICYGVCVVACVAGHFFEAKEEKKLARIRAARRALEFKQAVAEEVARQAQATNQEG
jgi:hypothetical protein